MMTLAHISEDGRNQTLSDHLLNVSKICGQYCSSIGLSEVGIVCGLAHDLGKASGTFQEYLTGRNCLTKGAVDHSTVGAQYLGTADYGNYAFCKESQDNLRMCREVLNMMQLCIVSHHSGLIDCLSNEGVDVFSNRLSKDLGNDGIDTVRENIDPKILEQISHHLPLAIEQLSIKVTELGRSAQGVRDKGLFRLGLLERYILSCLIDADHRDTRDFMRGTSYESFAYPWDVLCSRLDKYILGFSTEGGINRMRRTVSDQCFEKSVKKTGIFSLSVPTGGGKTLASLRFALNHARQNGLDRIIYVIPYTSIIDQNAEVMRNVLEKDGERIVLEYHSNLDGKDSDSELSCWRYYSDSWDVQIVVTTMVQYLNALFASGSGNIKKMHNLANSVLVFDEIQTLPVKCTYMFDESANFLTSVCGSTVLLCTATQPLLSNVKDYPLVTGNDCEIVSDPEGLSRAFKRCEAEFVNPNKAMETEEIVRFVLGKCESFGSILVITNTKSLAARVFKEVKSKLGDGYSLFHLSTNMCPAHRKKVLGEIRESLPHGKTICVSTQLIEAGVDVDFECVIRMLAGVDSIAQAAGRCNRHGLMVDPGKVFIVKSDENIDSLTDIREGRRCSQDVMREFSDPLSLGAISRYFEYYFYQRGQDMGYPIGPDETLFGKLSMNSNARNLHNKTHPKIRRLLVQSFMEANSSFRVIDENTEPVIVPYDRESRDLICDLCSEPGSFDAYELIRKLQKYTVNVFDLNGLLKNGIVREVASGSGIYVLTEGHYDDNLGLTRDLDNKTMIFRG